MLNQIKEYLDSENRDYHIGLALLSKVCKNRIMLQNLGRKENPGKVEYELKKVLVREEEKLAKQEMREKAEKRAIAAAQRTNKIKAWKPETPEDAKKLLDFVNQTELKQLNWFDQLVPMKELVTGEGKSKAALLKVLIEYKQGKRELDGIDADSNETKLPEIKEVGRTRVIKDKEVKFEDLPEELQGKWEENRDLYQESTGVHAKLKAMDKATDQERAPHVQRLYEISDLIRLNWNAIDAYDPENPNIIPENQDDFAGKIDTKRINANRKYISSNLKKLADNPKNDKVRAEMQKRINELLGAKESFKDAQKQKLIDLGFEVDLKTE